MASRYPGGPDSRPPPRDRSPPRFPDRRLSSNYGPSPSNYGPRGSDNVDSGRDPPRGPKALVDQPRHSSFAPLGPRGRGYGPGRDFNDRDRFRDRNDPLPFRRESDRPDWVRRDREPLIRDSRPPLSRDKSRSPPPLSRRPSPPGSSDSAYLRRDSKDFGPSSSRDAPSSSWSSRGGSFRGRGRGDWDGPRGRIVGDRPSFRPRSRSRERWHDNDVRDRESERESDFDRRDRFDRREPDRPSDRDERDRDGGWQKEMRPLGPTTPGSVAGSMKTPLSTPSSHSRTVENPAVKPTYDTPRRYSSSLTTSSGRKDNEKGDYFLSKPDPPSRAGLQRPASPQAAPQVPAFGAAIPYLGTTTQTSSAPKTAPAEKPLTTPKAPVQPDGPPANNAAPMQPPTAPRAQRDSSVPIQAASKGPGTSVQTKEEERPLKAPTGPSATRVDTIPTAPRSAIATDNRENANGPFQNIPSGPKARTLSSSSLRSDTPTGPATSPRPPFAAAPRPFGVDTSAPTPFASTIPTGPRSQRSAPAPKNQWISKDYNARKQPGAIQTSPPAPSSAVDSKEKLVGGLMSVRGTFAQGKENGPLGRNNEQLPDAQDRDDVKPIKEDLDRASEVKEQAGTAVTNMEESDRPTWSMQEPPSDEEPDDLGLDEEDFAASEARFREQQEKHASRKPPLPMDDAVVRELLVKIQLLGLIVAGDVPAELLQKKDGPNAADVEMADADQEVVPKIEEPEEDPVPKGRPLKEKPTISTETPPVDNLPFRTSGPPTPFSDFGVLDDDAEKRQALQECFRQDFEKQKVENEDKKLRLKEEFKEYYKPWRLTVDDLDRKKKAEKPLTPAPASPTLSSTTTAAPTPSLERTRGGRNMTELDIQNILKESEESARQEQERRDREDKKDPDYDKEAVIPAMIDNFERDEDNFNDTNQLIPPERALEVFGFVPPQDDFTEDEQKKFTQGFIDFPKKWGKIAQYVAETERDYHDCIVHYYLTKKEAGYKDILRRNQSRKGRKKGPKGGAKSNALMADLGVRPELYEGDEFDSAPAPVTDTGRPRRAAAPVFGDKEATDDGTSGSTSGKRGAASKDTNGDPNPDKPAKGRKAGGRTRKTKAKDSAAPPSAAQSPQKVDKEPVLAIKNGRAQTKELLPVPPEEIPVIDLQRPIDIKQPQVPPVVDGEPQSLVQVPTVQASQSSQPSQPSSYWSVPEQKDFPKLLAHFGKDFDAIATYMRTKTAIMVKNYFVRQCETKPELEVIAQDADAKKRRGIQTAPLPIPTTATPKRKYDATPSSVVQRPLAPSTETLNPGEEVSRDALQRPLLEEPAMPTGQRSPVKELHHRHQQQPVSIQSRPQVNPLAPRVEDTYQPGRPPAVAAQRPDQGPRRGFFAEDRPERRQSVSLTQPPIQIPPQQTVDRARPEQPPRHANLAPSRAPVSSAAQAPYPGTAMPGISQAPYMQQVGAQPVQSRSPMRHARNLSSTGHGSPVQAVLKHEPDTAPLRRPDSQTTFIPSYAGSPAQSPAMPRPVQPVHIPREPLRPSSTPAPPIEPPKVTPAKRSNIMSILNDEPSEGPPQKRPSLENNANRGPPAPSSTQSLAHQQAHNYGQTMQSRRGEPPQPMHVQQQQPPPRSAFTTPVSSLHPSTMQPGHQLAEYSSSYRQEANQSPAGRDSWLARYDPRSGSQNNAPPPSVEAPPPTRVSHSPYTSTVPPAHQASPRMTTVPVQSVQAPSSYHRLAMEQQQQQRSMPPSVPANPSPPPSFTHAGQPYRSSSASSHHSRVPSYGQPQGHTSMQPQNPPPQQMQNHPHSAGPNSLNNMQRQSSYPFDRGLPPNPAASYPPPQSSQHQHQPPQPQQPPPLSQQQQQASLHQSSQQQQRGYPGPPNSYSSNGPQGPPGPPNVIGPPPGPLPQAPPTRIYTPPGAGHYSYGQDLYQQAHHRHYSQGGGG